MERDLRGRFISPTGKPSRVPRPRTPEEEANIKRLGENIRRDLAETIWSRGAVFGAGKVAYQLKGLREDLNLTILGPEIWLYRQDAHVMAWRSATFHDAHIAAWLIAGKAA